MKKLFRRLLAVLLTAAAVCILANAIMILRAVPAVVQPQDAGQADCILVLGCGVLRSGEPGQSLTRRLDAALDLYRMGKAPKLLMSGDHGSESYDEVNAMKRYAVTHGVPAENVFMDHAGFSTYESMVRAREIFDCRSVLIVTQPYHVHRSLWNAWSQGLEAQAVAAEMFHGGLWSELRLYVREALARVKDMLWCLLKVPAVSGQVLPISGSGAQTDDAATLAWLETIAP